MREISPAVALFATKAADFESKLGIQIGEPYRIRPPRIYLSQQAFLNVGRAGVVTQVFEEGVTDAWEIPESGLRDDYELEERLADKAAECVQEHIDGFNPDDGDTLFLAGNEDMADDVIDRVDISGEITIKVNEGEPEYIPDPTA